MDEGKEIPQNIIEKRPPNEGWLRISGRSVASAEHPNRNEDSIAHSSTDGYAILLDGVGGFGGGDKASHIGRDVLAARLKAIPLNFYPDPAKRLVSDALIETSNRIQTEVPGGGTTATVVKFVESQGEKRAIIGHVGDSRVYILRNNILRQVTEDDSILSITGIPLQERKRVGQKLDQVATSQDLSKLSSQERTYFARRNEISQMLGDKQAPKPHIYHIALQDGDKIILTSDGVHDNLSQAEIDQIIKSNPPDLANALVERASARSSEVGHVRAKADDISAIVAEVSPANTPLEQTVISTESSLVRFQRIARIPNTPEALNQTLSAVVEVARDPHLTYSQAASVISELGTFFRARKGMDNTSTAPQLKKEYGEAYKKLMKMKEVADILDEVKRRARTNPDNFFSSGTTTSYTKRTMNGQTFDWPEETHDPYARQTYNFVTGVYPMRYLPNSPDTQKLVADYSRTELVDHLMKVTESLPNIETGPNQGWLFARSTEVRLNAKAGNVGRIYINPLPNQVHRTFFELARMFNGRPDVPFDLKIADPRTNLMELPLYLNRADKMVLYFDATHQNQILDIVRQFYEKCGVASFEAVTPKFTAKLRGAQGTTMNGIAFGQQPDYEGNVNTFSNLREDTLRQVWSDFRIPVDSPDYEKKFMALLREYKVDPYNPAFDWPTERGQQLFSTIAANSF